MWINLGQLIFQRAVKNMNKFRDDSKWLKDNLEELLQDSDDTNAQQERRQLENMLGRFNNLLPNMEKTSDKSALFSKAYDFRDGIDRRFSWLDDAQKQVMEEPFIDGLEDARTCLHEHEVCIELFIIVIESEFSKSWIVDVKQKETVLTLPKQALVFTCLQ